MGHHRDALLRRIGGDSTPPEPTMLGDKLRLLRRIGKGGMGTVWEAEHTGLGINVAVKRLQRGLAHRDELRRRFLREARSAARVKHPHIVEIFDVSCDDDGVPYLVMELLEGEPLDVALRRDGPLPWGRARVFLGQLLDALAQAHASGVVHRDIKPGNIIVSGWGTPTESVTIIDFGLAKQQSLDPETRDITHTGEVFGSPGYMSPEQLRSEAVDARADVYAIGCVAYEMLTGRKPFPGPTVADLIVQHLTHVPPPPSPVLAEASEIPAIQALVLRALHKDPARRPQSVAELVEQLSAVGHAGGWRRWVHPGARRRWVLAAGLGASLTVVFGMALQTESMSSVASAPFTEELVRPVDRTVPPWPTRWIGHELDQRPPVREPQAPSLTGADVPDDQVGVWGSDPREGEPYRILAPRRDVHALSEHAIALGLTLGHAVDDPEAAERHGRAGDPASGRVYWTDPREFPLRALGTMRVGPGCVGVQVGPVHVLTAAQCVWEEGGFVFDDLRWQPGDGRDDEASAVEIIRVYVPQEWPQRDRSGLFDWAVAITEHRIGDQHFGLTALADDDLVSVPLHHKGYPVEHDEYCQTRDAPDWSAGANRPWGDPEPLRVGAEGLRAPSPVSGWDRVLAVAQAASSGHGGGPYYFYDAAGRPVVIALHRSACAPAHGGSPKFCGYEPPWSCDTEPALASQAIRLEPFGLYGHIVPVLTWWGVDEAGRARCLLDGGC